MEWLLLHQKKIHKVVGKYWDAHPVARGERPCLHLVSFQYAAPAGQEEQLFIGFSCFGIFLLIGTTKVPIWQKWLVLLPHWPPEDSFICQFPGNRASFGAE